MIVWAAGVTGAFGFLFGWVLAELRLMRRVGPVLDGMPSATLRDVEERLLCRKFALALLWGVK